MNIISTDFKFFIEHDSNPFILFSNDGKVIYLNESAELIFLEPSVDKKLFNIALVHAPKSYGYKKTLLDLSLGSFQFYAINILYENDDEIAMHLYKKPVTKISNIVSLEGYSYTDLNLLLEANIELFKMQYKAKLLLFTDYDLPKFQLHQNNFSFLLRTLFAQFSNSKTVNITLKIKIGELIVVNDKKYPIVLLKIESDQRDTANDIEITKITSNHFINAQFNDQAVQLEIPAIS